MDDSITALISILGTIGGVLVGYGLATFTAWRENKNKVQRLQRLLYTDVLRIIVFLEKIVRITEGFVSDPQIKTDDAETLRALLEANRAATDQNLSYRWYSEARTEPYIFSQLPKKEQDAINRLYDFHLHITNVALVEAAVTAASREVDEAQRYKVRFLAEKSVRENTLKDMMKTVREGLDEKLLLDISTEQTRTIVTSIFAQERKDAVKSEEGSAEERSAKDGCAEEGCIKR